MLTKQMVMLKLSCYITNIVEAITNRPDQKEINPDTWFDVEFKKRAHYETSGGHITVVDISPAQTEDISPIVFVNGFMSNIDSFQLTMRGFYNSGRRVIGLNHSNRHSNTKHGLPFHDAISQKAEDLITLVDIMELENCDVIAHSEGFMVSMIASSILSQDKYTRLPFNNILGVSPAGVKKLGVDDALKSPAMLLKGAFEMSSHPNKTAIALNTLKYIGKNALKIPRESLAIMGTEVSNLINQLARQIAIGVLLVPKDEVISAKKLISVLESEEVKVRAYELVEGTASGHSAILCDQKTINSAISMMTRLKNLPKAS